MRWHADPRVRFLAGLGVYFTLLWLLWNTAAVYPLKIFVVLLHEISHGLSAVLTGGSIQRIVIDQNQGGLCECPSGNALLTLSAGYLGSLIWGGAIVATTRGRAWVQRAALGTIGLITVSVAILFVRNLFGLLFSLAFGASLVVAARYLPTRGHRIVLTIIGLTSCLYAVLDIKSDVLDRPELRSDARMLSELTGVPTTAWGIVWIVLAVAFCWWLLRWMFRGSARHGTLV